MRIIKNCVPNHDCTDFCYDLGSYRYHHVCYALLQVLVSCFTISHVFAVGKFAVGGVCVKQARVGTCCNQLVQQNPLANLQRSPCFQIHLRNLYSWMMFRHALLQSTQPRLMLLILAVSTFGLQDWTTFH